MNELQLINRLEIDRAFYEGVLAQEEDRGAISALKKIIKNMSLLIQHLIDNLPAPPVIPPDMREKKGIVFGDRGAFYEVEGFANMSGEEDFTFIAYVKSPANMTIFNQNTSFGSADRLTITKQRIYSGTATDDWGAYGEFVGLIVKRADGAYRVLHTTNGAVARKDLPTIHSVAEADFKVIGSEYYSTPNLNPEGSEIIAIQYLDSAISDEDAEQILTDWTIHPSPTQELLFYENATGQTDNGAYPAVMSDFATPAPYAASASFFKPNEMPWKAFDQNYNTRTILQDETESASAGAWLKIDLGAGNERACDSYFFRSWDGQGAESFTVSGSNDDSVWTELYTGVGLNDNTVMQKHQWVNATSYRYYRVTCNSGFHPLQWTSYFHMFTDSAKEWLLGAGYAVDGTMTFPT